jgi:sarcosine oxidase subunit gamma
MWLAPAEWLIYALDGSRASLMEMADPWVRSGSYVCADVSSGLSLLELSGPGAVELLAAGCGLDLEGNAVPQNHCAQTLFHQVALILHRPGGVDEWRLIVDRSLSLFLFDSLSSAHEVRSLRSR